MSEMSRAEVSKSVKRQVNEHAADIRRQCDALIPKILLHNEVKWSEVSNVLLNELAYNCAKDLTKLSIYQDDKVDSLKLFGYLAFWVRKLKPVVGGVHFGKPMKDVNERLSVWLLIAIVTRYNKIKSNEDPSYKTTASLINQRLVQLLRDDVRMRYLIHCMRARTFGPHHYVILLHQMVSPI